ncbi:alpha/beta hydrolase [Galbibacter sp.]|uniref:alpha/beta hydrolase n=1 Tax=Galbibacter sp. TaxID=2918471 RepID=UPI003A933F08
MMNKLSIAILFILMIPALGSSQDNSDKNQGFFPAQTNQPGKQYPMVNAKGKVRARITAPDANYVKLDIGGVKYDMVKDQDGMWSGESDPQDEGFHYYQLNIDGASVNDPGSKSYYGAGRWGSGIEIPAHDQDIYAMKKVPHGKITQKFYFSEITKTWRDCFIYTPPNYHKDMDTHYPVLYLQHGSFEDQTGWSSQGKANLILDNLMASGKAVSFIVVMENGYASRPASETDGNQNRSPSAFEDVMLDEVIPMIDAEYRTLKDRKHRAIAGLSMGANQTMRIFMNNLDKFTSYGGFSGTSNYPSSDAIDPVTFLDGAFKDGAAVDKKTDVFFLSLGTKEPNPFPGSVGAFKKMLEKQGIPYTFYESPGTAHEWQTWRRSLHEFAQLLFK